MIVTLINEPHAPHHQALGSPCPVSVHLAKEKGGIAKDLQGSSEFRELLRVQFGFILDAGEYPIAEAYQVVGGATLAFSKMDRIGHRRLQLIGFGVMAATFLAPGVIPALTSVVALFLVFFGLSYFFIEFGPNTTTFVLPSEVFPVSQRTTGHGMAAGVGKLGAFVGVFLVPHLQKAIGLRGMLVVAGAFAVLGYALTHLLPEPARQTLEDVSGETQRITHPQSVTVGNVAVAPRSSGTEPALQPAGE